MKTMFNKAEMREIEAHKYFLSMERGYDVGFDAARDDWLERYGDQFRRERQVAMLALQRQEIDRYKWIRSEEACRDLGREAALEWIKKYAATWREWYETEYEANTSNTVS